MSRNTYVTGAVLVLLAATVAGMVTGPPRLGWYLTAWALFCAALWLSRRVPERRLTALVVGGGLLLAAIGLVAPPSSSTDSFRYVWDGKVQAAGISPYDHPPSDPALAGLRDGWLFPADCAGPGLYPLPDGGCTRINRPTVPTIYPPLAQGYFLLVHWLSPEGSRHKALQLGGWAMAVLTLLTLCRLAGARRAALWAWCPAVPVEAVNNAHVDMVGVLLVALAFWTVRGRGGPPVAPASGAPGGLWARGALLGGAVAAKLLPATALVGSLSGVLANGVAWRRLLRVGVPAAAVVGLSYVPYVLASGPAVAGYLPGYLEEERYEGGGNRYLVLRLLLPDAWAPYAAIGVLALVILAVLRYGRQERPWLGALVVSGSLLLLFTPGYSWYALLVVALAAMTGRWEWLGAALAGAIAYVDGPMGAGILATVFYAAAVVAVLIGWAVRRPSGRTEHAEHSRSSATDPDHRQGTGARPGQDPADPAVQSGGGRGPGAGLAP
ncbi:glycosyltransferase 87 family protein [Nonomuraea fuscirosea]|uniref:glycosyltransferase 87 family protein n=1 Tax=Nonomuraea fuscirosea TaxID=1291556 RepID=UPI001FEBE17E|nr:glycosyltransferase 87 family protein [Nonomuraea fuscirosea]